jgi:SecD/SecF fusion protein
MNPRYRALLILAVVVVAIIQVVPTFGWLSLSEDERQARLDRWSDEDAAIEKPGVIGEMVNGVKRWAEFDRNLVVNPGLDLQGGVHVVVGINLDSLSAAELEQRFPEDQGWTRELIEERVQEQVLENIRRRVDEFEAKEPLIQKLGTNQVQVQLPGERDVQRAIDLIKNTAYLEFKLRVGEQQSRDVINAVNDYFDGDFMQRMKRGTEFGGGYYDLYVDAEQYERVVAMAGEAAEVEGLLPTEPIALEIAFGRKPQPGDANQLAGVYVLEKEPLVTGEGLTRAGAGPDTEMGGGRWEITFDFDAEGSNRFGQATEANIGRPMAIVLDGRVESAPNINGAIYGNGVISGDFTREEALDLAISLNSGSMPVELTEDLTGVVGATLGADSVRRGITSAGAGIFLVVIFMLIYYRVAGIIATIALLANALLVVAALAYFNATLTLPGIAGLILTIGMAVDANVLIFERIREEVRNGKGIHASVDSGFKRATVTILDANITTLIAAAILFEFGTGPIQGFAVTLSIGVCSSVFCALVISRAVFDLLLQREWLGGLSMMAIVSPETKINFLGTRKIAAAVSAIALLIGFATFAVRGADNFGVDFTTGTNMIVKINTDNPVDVASVRSDLTAGNFVDAVVTEYGEPNEKSFMIRLGDQISEGDDSAGDIATKETILELAMASLADSVGGIDNIELVKGDTIGPAVGDQLKKDTVWAVLTALFFIIIYLWFRFELRFAVAAVVALAHDVLITLGAFAIAGTIMGGYQISLAVVAAILTIIGYSLNDTIVVFDRVREDLRLYRGRGMSYLEVLNISLNHTLARTVLTSLTTLFVVVVLFIFGGEVIRDFAFALIVGVSVGTYSSIFVASPAVYFWSQYFDKGKAAQESDDRRGGKGGGKKRRNKKKSSDDSPE